MNAQRGTKTTSSNDGISLCWTSPVSRRVRSANYETIIDSIPHIVWITSADGQTEYLNKQAVEYTGLSPESNYGQQWLALIHPDDLQRVLDDKEAAMTHGAYGPTEYRIRHHDGQYHWVEVRAVPFLGDDGRLEGWMGTCTDIEHRRRLEDELRHSERSAAEALTLLETIQSSAPLGIGFVDSEYRYVHVNERLAETNGRSVAEHLGRTVAEVIPKLWPMIKPLYEGIMGTGLPATNIEMKGETPADPGVSRSWLVNLYPVRLETAIIGIGIIVNDITERIEAEHAQLALMRSAIGAIANTVEARDPYTAGHEQRVAEIAGEIATDLGLSTDEVEGIRLAAEIHDIGKISIPSEILSRPGKLAPAEFELIKGHSQSGHDIVAKINFPWPVATMILQHHERIDGAGYPNGLRGTEIILGARIIAVADVLEAMSSHRPYRPAKSVEIALAEIRDGRGTLFDPVIVDSCLKLFSEGRISLQTNWGDDA